MMETDGNFGETTGRTAHHSSKPASPHRSRHERKHHDDIAAAIQELHHRLDTLASMTTENILMPGDPQEPYHQIVEEAYAVLGSVETEVDALRVELEYQHKRLDSARDAALAEATREGEELP